MNTETGLQVQTVDQLIKDNFGLIKSILPKHLTPEKMARLVVNEVRRTPKLAECTSESLIGAVMVAAQAGLEIGPFGYAFLIPRKNNQTGKMEVNFQLGYKGAMRLVWNSGHIGGISPSVVCDTDFFEYEKGTSPFVKHIPCKGQPGKITHFYTVAKNLLSGEMQSEVMTKWEIDYIRDTYAQGIDRNSSPWQTSYDAMGMKTCIVRLCKYLPMSAESQRVISLDEMIDVGADQNLGAEVPANFRTPGKDPRDLLDPKPEPNNEIDTSVKMTKAQAPGTCGYCDKPVNVGDDIAFKYDDQGNPHVAHEICHTDHEQAEEK